MLLNILVFLHVNESNGNSYFANVIMKWANLCRTYGSTPRCTYDIQLLTLWKHTTFLSTELFLKKCLKLLCMILKNFPICPLPWDIRFGNSIHFCPVKVTLRLSHLCTLDQLSHKFIPDDLRLKIGNLNSQESQCDHKLPIWAPNCTLAPFRKSSL